MKKYLVILTLLLSYAGSSLGFEVPKLVGPVNDYAEILSETTKLTLGQKLITHHNKTGVQIAILTVKTIDSMAIEDASIKVANSWGLGDKSFNNGLLIMISMQERAIRIEVGSGIEDAYTDSITGRIIDKIIIPNFKNKEFDQGMLLAADALCAMYSTLPPINTIRNGTNDIEFFFKILTTIMCLYLVVRFLEKNNNITNKLALFFDTKNILWKTLSRYFAGFFMPLALETNLESILKRFKFHRWYDAYYTGWCFSLSFLTTYILAKANSVQETSFLKEAFMYTLLAPMFFLFGLLFYVFLFGTILNPNSWKNAFLNGSSNSGSRGSSSGSGFSGGGGGFRGGGSSGKF